MNIQHDILLSEFTTMKLGGRADYLTEVSSKKELIEALSWANESDLPVLILGGGSNVIFKNGFAGLVILNKILGFEVLSDHLDSTLIQIGAGESWDKVVSKTVDMELSGIEMLSAIPGTAGATPVQNVGAYGAEIADTFIELEAFDTNENKFVNLSAEDCQFSYRNSIFKSPQNRHHIICNITLKLKKDSPKPPFYSSLQKYLDEHKIKEYTPKNIRKAVVAIRKIKLPDPKKIPNTGSFFKNPIVEFSQFEKMKGDHPEMPYFEMPDEKIKLLAGWLIDQAGLKGYQNHGMKVYEQNALVFVNESAQNYSDLEEFKNEVITKVEEKFGIVLEQEPELI